jgi:putative FmdB family regulatory protein
MPSYDLECGGCGLQFEIFRHGFLRDEDRVCAGCASTQVAQRFTGFVTARPARDRSEPTVRGFGHSCASGCGCNRARMSPRGEVIPP